MSKRPPLGLNTLWEAVMEPAGYQCQCTGGLCGSKHADTGMRCIRVASSGRLLVAPADLTLSPAAAAAVPTDQLRAWCRSCHVKAQRRQLANQRELERQSNSELSLPLWPDPAPTLTSCACTPPSRRPCGHCIHCDACLDCTQCAGAGCTCECEG